MIMCPSDITVQIKFNPFDEPDTFTQLANYPRAFSAISDFASELRQIQKYRTLTDAEAALVAEISEKFFEIFEGVV